jgi:predicted Zn-dependent protease with MMP-like domain
MMTIDDAWDILDEAAAELPEEFFGTLNGGISLVPQSKRHEADGLYILGEYHRDPMGMGNYITIYFGSFRRVFHGASDEELKQELRKTLRHEFTHHVETMAGERGLEKKDEEALEDYLNGW